MTVRLAQPFLRDLGRRGIGGAISELDAGVEISIGPRYVASFRFEVAPPVGQAIEAVLTVDGSVVQRFGPRLASGPGIAEHIIRDYLRGIGSVVVGAVADH